MKAGDERFGKIDEMLNNFRDDMKAIANQFGEQVQELKEFIEVMNKGYNEQMKEMSETFGTVINGDAERGFKGHEERLTNLEIGIARIYKVAGIVGAVGVTVLGYFAKMFWTRMNEVLTAIEAVDKIAK